VDDSAPVPFLLQASAGAIAITGARAAGFGPVGAGRLRLREHLLPGIPGGLLIKQRKLALGALVLGDQSILLVDPADWPHGQPRRGAAGVLGYDLLRRFIVEFDLGGERLRLHRPGGVDTTTMAEAQRLSVLGRVPYFEARLEPARGRARWLRLQFEPAEPVGICLDRDPRGGVVVIAGQRITLADAPCEPPGDAQSESLRDGVLGAAAMQGLVVVVDYERGGIGFRPRDD
jgi:hypothetical protein